MHTVLLMSGIFCGALLQLCFIFAAHTCTQSKRQEDMQKKRTQDAINRHKQVSVFVSVVCVPLYMLYIFADMSLMLCPVLSYCISVCLILLYIFTYNVPYALNA